MPGCLRIVFIIVTTAVLFTACGTRTTVQQDKPEYFLEKVAQRERPWQAVRTERWKYIHYTEDGVGPDELYDLESDPGEYHNLIAEPAMQSRLDNLQRELNDLLEATN